MRDIDWTAPAPCRTQHGVADCICPECLVIANRIPVVLLAWVEAREEFVEEYLDQARDWAVADAEEAGRESGEDELAPWYAEDLAKMDAYVDLALGEPTGPLSELTEPGLRSLLLTHPRARDQAPCRLAYSPTERCSCPEHRTRTDNTCATVIEDLVVRRRTLRQFEAVQQWTAVSAFDRKELAGIGTWLRDTLDLSDGELATFDELTDAGLSAEQAMTALRLAHGG